jgi:membrane-associated phospholipid phosphatase
MKRLVVGLVLVCRIVRADAGWGSPRESLAMAWHDTTSVLAAPARWDGSDWAMAGGGLAAIGAVAAWGDDPVRTAAGKVHGRAMDRFTNLVQPVGAEYSFGILGAFALAGWALHDTRLQEIALDGAVTSVLAAGLICNVVKVPVGRSRPYQADNPWRFRPFGGHVSFPSGHTSQAFSVLSVVAFHSDSLLVRSACFALAASVGWARIYHDRHWTSDVLGGALLGTSVGWTVVRVNGRSRTPGAAAGVGLRPWVADGAGGLAATARFK